MSGKLKFNFGCGNKPIQGFINVDIQPGPGVDLVWDVTQLVGKIQPSCADTIYCCHTLEHIDKKIIVDLLKEWRSFLKPGGIIRIAVPDFEAIVEWYINGGSIDNLVGLTVGGNKNAFDNHKNLFDFHRLGAYLLEAGFRNIRSWDWKETEHKDHDDFSQAYLPHMQKETGMLMSLNLEATNP
jgi:predicted SAM-dependent methyltransferase